MKANIYLTKKIFKLYSNGNQLGKVFELKCRKVRGFDLALKRFDCRKPLTEIFLFSLWGAFCFMGALRLKG